MFRAVEKRAQHAAIFGDSERACVSPVLRLPFVSGYRACFVGTFIILSIRIMIYLAFTLRRESSKPHGSIRKSKSGRWEMAKEHRPVEQEPPCGRRSERGIDGRAQAAPIAISLGTPRLGRSRSRQRRSLPWKSPLRIQGSSCQLQRSLVRTCVSQHRPNMPPRGISFAQLHSDLFCSTAMFCQGTVHRR